jgi:hypothetical protein
MKLKKTILTQFSETTDILKMVTIELSTKILPI